MNLVLDDDELKQKKLKRFYISILAICVIAILAAFIIQIVKDQQATANNNNVSIEEINDQINVNREQFSDLFKNKVNYLENNAYKITKIDENKEIVYLGYKNDEIKVNDYELDVNIPYINIDTSTAKEFNTQIKDIFENKAKSVLNSQNNNVLYTVDYSAYISNNILSLVVRSTLKEGSNPQREIIQTYNYDLKNHKECSIDDILALKGITKKQAGQTIKIEIKEIQERVEELASLGCVVYARDYTDDIYNINNVTEYFLGKDNVLYIIYAYGNNNHTNEMDIVIM